MKRTFGFLAGLATLGLGILFGSQLGAQQQPAQPQKSQLQTRIALVNLGQAFKQYKKFQDFEAHHKATAKGMQVQFEAKQKKLIDVKTEVEKPETTATRREQLQKEGKKLHGELTDMRDEFNQKMAKDEADHVIAMYRELKDTVDSLARTWALELVLQYTDAAGTDAMSPGAIQGKLRNNACLPIYFDPRMDITIEVAKMLNLKYGSTAAPPPPPAMPRGGN